MREHSKEYYGQVERSSRATSASCEGIFPTQLGGAGSTNEMAFLADDYVRESSQHSDVCFAVAMAGRRIVVRM